MHSDTCPIVSPSSFAIRVPRRSARQVFEIPISDENPSAVLGNDVSPLDHRRRGESLQRVAVAAIPSGNRNCRHQVFVEDGERLKKLDLPSTSCVTVSQRFEARAADTLTFDFVMVLQVSNRFDAGRTAVRAILVHRGSKSATSLMDRCLDDAGGVTHRQRIGSRFRESQSFTIEADGQYELRFITTVDHDNPGCEAHLLVDAIRVVDPSGRVAKQLASFSCVGRVRQQDEPHG
jgi:hypothetical protein